MLQQGQFIAIVIFEDIAARLSAKLKTPIRTFFLPLFLGALLAIAQRRTVTKWLRAAGLSEDFRKIFYHMRGIGRKHQDLFDEMLGIILEQLGDVLETAPSIRLVLDDTPTKRYGGKVEGAGHHHNPTPGKTDATFCFGHSWVVCALVVTHPLFGEISLPIAAELYLRQKEVDKLKDRYGRQFQKKTEIAVSIVKRLVPQFKVFEKNIEVIVDGGYSNETVLSPLNTLPNVTVITRLRRDAVLFEKPPVLKGRGRGRPKKYGKRIDVKSMVDSAQDWRWVECRQYGQIVQKQVKSFVATSRVTRGAPIKIVIVKEATGIWVPLMTTDVQATDVEVLESYAVRFGIEETFKDLKEV